MDRRVPAFRELTDRGYQFVLDAEVPEVFVEDKSRIGNDLGGVMAVYHVAYLVHFSMESCDRTGDGRDIERNPASSVS